MQLAGQAVYIARIRENLGYKFFIHRYRLTILTTAYRSWITSCQETGTAGRTNGICAEDIGQTRSLAGQSVQGGRGIQHGQALSLLRPLSPNWSPVVLSVSSVGNRGIDDVWATILEHAAKLEASGERQSRRAEQARAWMWSLVEEGLRQAFRGAPAVVGRIEELEQDVEGLKTTPAAAARVLLEAFKNS